ncbi:DNA repair protein RadC [Patescibacteria group bacterium]
MNLLPREKLQLYGPKQLNNSDLIAIVLGHATKKESVFDLSKRLLKEYGQTPLQSMQNVAECQKLFKIGQAQASKILACFEIGRRFFGKDKTKNKLTNAHEVFSHVKDMLDLKKEYIRGLYLNTRHELIYDEVLSIGTLESTSLHPREVFYPAIQRYAYTFILVHNHPSGNPEASEEDFYLTQEIVKAGDLFRIPLLDHVIVSKNGYYSFQEHGTLSP